MVVPTENWCIIKLYFLRLFLFAFYNFNISIFDHFWFLPLSFLNFSPITIFTEATLIVFFKFLLKNEAKSVSSPGNELDSH